MTGRTEGTDCVVVDTNVLVVAGGQRAGTSDACEAACVSVARAIHDGQIAVAVDSDGRIVAEYARRVRSLAGSSVGGRLAIALSRRFRDPTVCLPVDVTPIDDPPGSYEEVPDELRDFDRDDQVFIAVAVAEASRPPIFTAVDGEWWTRRADFSACGIDVQHLCVGDLLR